MARWFNIGGPCNPADNYMLSAMERLPEVATLVRKRQYFIVHAPRQCGKTTAFLSFANEMNSRGDAIALYCSLETVQEFPKAVDGIPKICALLQEAVGYMPAFGSLADAEWPVEKMKPDAVLTSGIKVALSRNHRSADASFVHGG